jgi:predicted membrane GTPase involved in stress response
MKITLILSVAVCVLSLQFQARTQQALQEKLTMSNGTRAEESSSATANTLGRADEWPVQGRGEKTNAILCSEVKAREPFQYSMVQTPPRNLSRTIDRLDCLDWLNG